MLSINTTDAQGYEELGKNKLTASVAFSFNSGTNVLTITDNTVYPDGDERKAVNIELFDKFGKKKPYQIDDDPNNVTINVVNDGFNKSEGLYINVTVVSANGLVKDGSIQEVATEKLAGNVVMEK